MLKTEVDEDGGERHQQGELQTRYRDELFVRIDILANDSSIRKYVDVRVGPNLDVPLLQFFGKFCKFAWRRREDDPERA